MILCTKCCTGGVFGIIQLICTSDCWQARLKLDRRTSAARREFIIIQLLKILGLTNSANTQIGTSGDKVLDLTLLADQTMRLHSALAGPKNNHLFISSLASTRSKPNYRPRPLLYQDKDQQRTRSCPLQRGGSASGRDFIIFTTRPENSTIYYLK